MSPRRLRWDAPRQTRTTLKRPYRDTALVYGAMSIVIVVVAIATGGSVVNAVGIALVFFVIATLWTWRTWRNRLRAEQANPNTRERR
jgi:Flp pilus assembly protein TadB